MPIGGTDGIGWDESVPADTESLAQADDRMRSIKTTVRQVLDSEHNFPSAGGNSVGYHRLGSARPYYGTQSAVSSSGTNGRLMQTSDTSRLFGVGSGGTTYIGGPTGISMPNGSITMPQRSHWVEEVGAAQTNGDGRVVVVIQNSGYSGQPYLFVSGYTTNTGAGRQPSWGIVPGGTTEFTVWAWDATFSLSQGSCPFFWRSIGTRAL